jgi:hypothetical protein
MPWAMAAPNFLSWTLWRLQDRWCDSMIGHLSTAEVNGPRVERSSTKELKYSL